MSEETKRIEELYGPGENGDPVTDLLGAGRRDCSAAVLPDMAQPISQAPDLSVASDIARQE